MKSSPLLLGLAGTLCAAPILWSAESNQPGVARPVSAAEPKAYVLAANDVVEVTVYQEADMSTKATITKEGTITLPLVGPVPVVGKTAEQASTAIRDLLARDYLVNPKVQVTVIEYTGRRFTILGEVRSPGTYKMSGAESINLLDAIATAGGYTRIGSPSRIRVTRTVNGEQKVFKLDAAAMARDNKALPFEILPGDTVTVLETIF